MPKKRLWYSYSHGVWDPDLGQCSHHHECLDTHCPLDVSQESIDDFRSWQEFLIHAER